MNTPIDTIFSWFKTGDFPTQAQFQATFSAFYHKNDLIPRESIEGLEEIFELFISAEALQRHLEDPEAHAEYLALLNAGNLTPADIDQWKTRLGIHHTGIIDSSDTLGNVYTKIQVDDFVNTLKNADKDLLSAIDTIRELLLSNDLSLDELQEIVDFIKKSREDIEALKAVAGETNESKVKLLNDYEGLGSPQKQQEFNKQIYDKVMIISQTLTSAMVRITESAVFPNILETEHVIIQARDSVTGKKINVDDYATTQTIEIKMVGQLTNPINILILKVKP
ncbi:hypothetical protein VUJ46_07315 [Chryseobacterium sp. MYb264]|uniref:hypothetical protein n=1 Tax=Chryseobacterium sp. MYb264 TaxID=2745153 RepID=UPI002E157715|nr:hypothetical protein VUJ46_07315 [Chryseobacterium sp. MYb264]